jgi:hypothetical protein
MRQAEYYKTVLDEHLARLDEDLTDHCVALAQHQESGQSHAVRRLRQMIREKRREQFELDCLLQALNHRFFPSLATRSRPLRRFDIDITPHGRCWRIRISEIDELIKAGSRDQAEMLAREHIAVSIGTRIAEVAVRVVAGRKGLEEQAEGPGFGAGQA